MSLTTLAFFSKMLAAHGLEELFSIYAVVSVSGSGWKWFQFYILMYLEYNTVVVFC